ncbi:autotransporter-associated beta strand repeat-containing protein [Verrucomicrobium sp. BvORR106]|uniref:autotransporter-associated beta strand repeat-containing protein n=1 Tax=Verrucomicrobium sp. BvORR106 TaxID=1403819 RepID=UPI002241049D|nr:autotransporter-associated beta strand repeat-containing protein [Verrucomicrobium sp. BvORR106]
MRLIPLSRLSWVRLLLGSFLLGSTANAQLYWDSNGSTAGAGSTPTGTWGSDSFWSTDSTGSVVPGGWLANSIAVFSAGTDATNAYSVSVTGTQDIAGITFEEGTVTLGGAGILNVGSGAGTFNVANGLVATINNVISSSTASATVLTKTGTGTLVLGNTNTFAAGKRLAIQAGTLRFASNGALGASGTIIELGTSSSVATMSYTGNTATIAQAIALGTLAGSSTGNTIELTNTSATTLTFSGIISGGPANSVLANNVLTLRGQGASVSEFVFSNTGNTFKGGIIVDNARFTVNDFRDFGQTASGENMTTTLINGGNLNVITTLDPTAAGANDKRLAIGTGGGIVTVASGITYTLNDAGQFSGTGILTKNGDGILALGSQTVGYGANYSGAKVTLNAGTLSLRNATAVGTGATQASLELAGGILDLRFDTATAFGNHVQITGSTTINVGRNSGTAAAGVTHTLGVLSMGGQTLNVRPGSGTSNNTTYGLTFSALVLTGSPTFDVGQNGTGTGTLTFSSLINNGGAVTLTKNNLGTLALAAPAAGLLSNSVVRVNSGTILALASGAIGQAHLQLGDTTGSASASFLLGASGIVFDNSITINNNSGVTRIGGGTFAGTSYIASDLNLTKDITLTAGSGATVVFSGLITDGASTYNLSKDGAGLVVVDSVPDIGGSITVLDGALGGDQLLQNFGVILNGGTVARSGIYNVQIGGLGNQVSWALNGSGGFSATNEDLTVTVTGSGSPLIWSAADFINGTGSLILGHSSSTAVTTFTNDIDLNNSVGGLSRTVAVNDNASSTADRSVLTGVLSNSGADATLTKTGNGILELSGASGNTHTGGTTIVQGTLLLNKSAGNATGLGNLALSPNGAAATVRLLNNEQIADTATVTVTSTTTTAFSVLDLNGFQETIGSLVVTSATGSGALVRLGENGVLTVNGNIVLNSNRDANDGSTHARNVVISGTGTVSATGAVASSGILDLGGAIRTITVQTTSLLGGNNDASIDSVIRNGGIIKNGARVLVLNGENTYAGSTTINAGAIRISSDGNLGAAPVSSTSSHLVLNGGRLETTASFTLAQTRGLELGSGGGTIDVATGTTLTYNGASIGTGGLTKLGAGTLILGGEHAYSGSTTLTAGTMVLNHVSALPGGITSAATGGNLNINGGVLGLGAGNFTRNLGTGTGQVQFTGSGGFAAYGANRQVNFGGSGTTVTWGVGGFLSAGSTLILGAADATHTIEIVNQIQLATTSAARTIQVNDGSAAIDAFLSGGLVDSGTFGFTKTGSGTLRVGGTYAGTWTLSGGAIIFDTAQTANIRLDGGVYESNNTFESGGFTRAVGTGSGQVQWTANGGGFAANGGALTVNLGTPSLVWGGTANFLTASGPLIFGSTSADNVVTWQNAIDLNNTATASVVRTITVVNNANSTADYAIMSGVLSTSGTGSVNLTKNGSGLLELQAANTYSGTTIVNEGTLRLGVANALPATAGLTINALGAGVTATLDLKGFTQNVGAITLGGSTTSSTAQIIDSAGGGLLTLGGNVTYSATGNPLGALISANVNLGSVSRTFDVGDSTTVVAPAAELTLSGIVSGSTGFIKSGAGRLLLSNNNNTFSGPITITAGVLSFTSIGNVNGGASALGSPATAVDGTIIQNGGSLEFVGNSSYATDRNIDANSASADLTIAASGTNGAVLTWNGSFSTDNRILILDGTGIGIFNGLITANDGATSTATPDLYKRGTGTWTINTATTIEDDLVVEGGTLILNVANAFTADDVFVRGNSTLRVAANSGFTSVDDLNVAADGSAGTTVLDLQADASATDLFMGTSTLSGVITGTGTLTLTTADVRQGSIDSGVTIAGGSFTKTTSSTFTFSGTNTQTGTLSLTDGTLILDYSTANTSKIGASLTLGSTNPNRSSSINLVLNGSTVAHTIQNVTGTTTITPGRTTVSVNAGGTFTTTLALTTFTRTSYGGTVNFNYSSANAKATTTAPAGVLGWATVTSGGTQRIAAVDGSGNIVQAATVAKSNVRTWLASDNIISSGAFANSWDGGIGTISSLTFDGAVASTLDISAGSRLKISSGGILVTSNVGSNNLLISGGEIESLATTPAGDLIIHQENVNGTLTIASNIVNAGGVTKSGNGTLILSGKNSFLSSSQLTISQGTVQVSGGNAIGDSTIVFMRQGTVLDLNNSNETIGRLGGADTNNLGGGTIRLGSGTLTVNQNTSTGHAGVLTGSGTLIKTNTAGNLLFTGNNTGFTGKVIINGGTLILSGSAGRMNAATSFTINNTGSFLLDNNDDSAPNDRLSDTAVITLHSANGAFAGESRPRGLAIRTDNNTGEPETFGLLDIASGASYASLEAGGDANSTVSLIAVGWNRSAGATLNVRGRGLGATANQRSFFKIADANDTAFLSQGLVGGGAASGGTNKNVSIVPWAIGENISAGLADTNMGNTFLTYVDNIGFRPLDLTNEYNTYSAAASTDNVRESQTGATTNLSGKTINSLILHNANAAAATTSYSGTGAGQTLAITSGAMLFTLNSAAAAGSYNTTLGGFDGGITVGSTNEYIIHVVNPSSASTTPTLTATIDSSLNSTNASLVKSGRGALILTAANTYGGGTYINEGVLQVGNLSNLGTGNVNFAGGTLTLAAGFSEDFSVRSGTINSAGGTINAAQANNLTLANGLDFTLTGTSNATLTLITRSSSSLGQVTIQGSSTFTGTLVVNHTSVNSGNTNSVVLNGDTNAAVNGNLQIGNLGSIPDTSNDAVVALGASEQIVDTAVISFRGSNGESAYFKLLGFNETVAGISDTSTWGVIENRETDTVSASGTLTIGSSSDYSYNGFMRDVNSGAADAAKLLLVKQGSGTQTLIGANIRHSGLTTITGGTLVLQDVTNWQSAIVNNSQLVLNQTTGTRTHAQSISGSGAVRKSGAGILVLTANNAYAGKTVIAEGVLEFNNSLALGNNAVGNTIEIQNDATLRANGAELALGSNQGIKVSGTVANIEVSSSLLVQGGLTGGVETRLDKEGAGALTVEGTVGFTGDLAVNAGSVTFRSPVASLGRVSLVDGTSLVLNGAATASPSPLTFSGSGNVLTLGTANTVRLGFGLSSAGNDSIILAAGQTFSTGTTVFTDIFVNGTLTGPSHSYNLIQSTASTSYAAFTAGVIYNPGNYIYTLNNAGANNLVLTATQQAAATAAYWKGDLTGGAAGVWNAAQIGGNTNWSTDATGSTDTGVAPGATTNVFFSAAGSANYATTLGADMTVNSVTFLSGSGGPSGNNTTVGGNHVLTLAGQNGLSLAAASGDITMSTKIAMGLNQIWTVADAGATLTASGNVSGSFSLTKQGLGTLSLTGVNGYTGKTIVQQGTLKINSESSLGAAPVAAAADHLTIESGATLQTTGNLTIDDAGRGVTLAGVDTATISTDTGTTAIISNQITGTAGLTKAGDGTLVITAANTYAGRTVIAAGTLQIGSEDNLGSAPGTFGADHLTIQAGGQLQTLSTLIIDDINRGVRLAGTGVASIFTNTGTSATIDNVISGAGTVSLQKLGAGNLVLKGSNTYTGNTIIRGGTLTIGATNTLVTTSTVTLGNNTADAGTLDVSSFDQTLGGLVVSSTTNSTANNIVIGAGRTLRVNGNVTFGSTTSGATTNTVFSGGGSFVVAGTPANASILIGASTGASNNTNGSTVDMSGLSNFTATLGTGELRIGDTAGSTGGSVSSLRLATNNSITATNIHIGNSVGLGSNAFTMTLGSGTNTLNATTINVGSAGGGIRSGGNMIFHNTDSTGSITIRGLNGGINRVANFNIINSTGNTGSNMVSVVDFTNHTADLRIATMTMAVRSQNTGSATATLSFNQGSLDITTLIMAGRTVGSGNATATLNLGDSVAEGTPTTSIGTITMASNTTATGTSTSEATINVTGGDVTIGSGVGTAINMANASAGRTVTSTINLTGGNITMQGGIVRTNGGGTENTTITLDGATLDMNFNEIGNASAAIAALNFRSGVLKNVMAINGAGGLTKTSSGNLIMEGTNVYSGPTTVAAGTLQVGRNNSGSIASATTVQNAAKVAGTGTISNSVNLNAGGILAPGDSAGAGMGTLVIAGEFSNLTMDAAGARFEFGAQSSGISFANQQLGFYDENSNLVADYIDPLNRVSGANDRVEVGGSINLVAGGVISIDFSGYTPKTGDAWDLMDWGVINAEGILALNGFTIGDRFRTGADNGLYDLDLPDLSVYGSDLKWDTSLFASHGILVVVPEPGRVCLLLIGLTSFLIRRRRHV